MKKSLVLLFWPCLAIVLVVFGWLTYSILQLDYKRNSEIQQRILEEKTRLALWHMDASLARILSDENKRSPQDFFETSDCEAPEYVLSYFQVSPDGELSIPQLEESGLEDKLAKLQKELVPEVVRSAHDSGGILQDIAAMTIPEAEQVAGEFKLSIEPAQQAVSGSPSPEEPIKVAMQVANDPNMADAESEEMQKAATEFLVRSKTFPGLTSTNAVVDQMVPSKNAKPALKDASGIFTTASQLGNNTNIAIPRINNTTEDPRSNSRLTQQKANNPIREGFDLLQKELRENLAGSVIGGAIGFESFAAMKEPPVNGAQALFAGSLSGNLPEMNTNNGLPKNKFKTTLELASFADDELMPAETISWQHIPLSISAFTPLWIEGELILIRNVGTHKQSYIQGVWVDWKKLEGIVLKSAKDILPNASLKPFTAKTVEAEHITRLLSSVPFTLSPGDLPIPIEGKGINTVKLTVAVSWVFALMAAAGVALLIIGMLRLSERRATFVSAVTHELRTPLTTFNLYTEMMMHGMVPQQNFKEYIATLQQEAARLTHLVDNVLSFSRIEKSTQRKGLNMLNGQKIKEGIESTIGPIFERAEMNMHINATTAALKAPLLTNQAAVDQILVNLADNTVKYARDLSRDVDIRMDIQGRNLRITFKDYGRGIPGTMRMRLFTPFSRSAEDAAGDKPGIGLGLALSHEIAKRLGGELRFDKTHTTGTCFHLYLPLRR